MPDLYVINIKPNHWKICQARSIYGIPHAGHTPKEWRTQGRWSQGDICIVRVSHIKPKGARAIWYFESERHLKPGETGPWKKFDCEWLVQLRPLVEFETPYSEHFEGRQKAYSPKIRMSAQKLRPSVVKFNKSQVTNYVRPLIREKKRELVTEAPYLGRKVRLDTLLLSLPSRKLLTGPSSKDLMETRRIVIARKYPGGEGEEHKKLKEWIAQHPEEIGLRLVKGEGEPEYVFPSGDAVDILFELVDNRYAVVEVETWNPLPGCYQALKYKVLKCAELGWKVGSPAVEAIVVARIGSDEIMRFCAKYGIRFVKTDLKI